MLIAWIVLATLYLTLPYHSLFDAVVLLVANVALGWRAAKKRPPSR